jgi:cellulose synthase/poly-beta-1,6-N-acetylglucosamine synthase-like glycosyltransferase
MHFDLLTGIGPLLALLGLLAVVFLFLLYPLVRRYGDDQGDGLSLVLLPPPRLPEYWRVPLMIAVFVLLYVLNNALTGTYSPSHVYAGWVSRVANSVVNAPSQVEGYVHSFTLGIRFLIFASILCFAVMGRGSLLRRLLVAWQAVIFAVVMLFVDALLIVLGIVVGAPIGPATLMGNFVAVGVGFLALTRMQYANYAVPKPSAVPFVKRPRAGDAFIVVSTSVAAMALCMAMMLLVYHLANPRYRPALALILPLPFAELVVIIRTAMLAAVNLATVVPEPPVTEDRPPIDVIIPAYNEEEVIEATLESVDRAAGRYGAPVNVILVNDGSSDRTRELALACMARFRYATGNVYDGRHGGKSEALNAGLERTTTDIVVRIDADTIVGEWALYYVPRWFQDPRIGLVEPMIFPRWRRSVYPHMRLFEELRQFGFNHRAYQTVDGVNVVPGVFTAFRREVALQLRGFTVGMNGEDGDFTLRFSRLGYRTWMDPKVIAYEDVPVPYKYIREQRVRWARAVHHNQARHGPYRAGFATPKVWFNQMQQFFKCGFAPARIMVPAFLLLTAIFEASYRPVIVLFVATWVVGSMVFIALETALAAGYGQLRHVGWALVWPFWQECHAIFAAEAWLSLPGRPAGLRGTSAQRVTSAVIH